MNKNYNITGGGIEHTTEPYKHFEDTIDEIYDYVKKYFGVLGGKIVGAGGGGFLLLFAEKNHFELEKFMSDKGYQRLHFDIDNSGSKIIGNF